MRPPPGGIAKVVIVFIDGFIVGLWGVSSGCVPRRGHSRGLVHDNSGGVLERFPSSHINALDRRKLEILYCVLQSKVAKMVELGVGPKIISPKGGCITIKIPFCDCKFQSQKRGAAVLKLVSATRTSFCNRGECRREKN